MSLRALIIDARVRAAIAAAVKRAEAKPIPMSVVRAGAMDFSGEARLTDVKLADRPPGFERPPSEHVLIRRGYRAAFSIEEQPAGFCRHLSVSVDQLGKLPTVAAVRMISAAYGMQRWDHVWLEEFDPGHRAVNVLELYRPAQQQRA